VFNDGNFYKPTDEMYELTLYQMTHTEAITKMREQRDALLDKSDKYMTRDYPHRLEKDIQDWEKYRQALRDLPITSRPTLDEDGNVLNVDWPTPP
jgi:predicted  nucleic acid-binding Zn-ribbon protein